MYKRGVQGWAKHLDFILLDCICLGISFLIAYVIRFGLVNPFRDKEYKSLFIAILIINFLAILFLDTMKNVLKRGYYREFVVTLFQALVVLLGISTYLFTTQYGAVYSRFTIFMMVIIYGVLSYGARIALKKHLITMLKNNTNNALVIIANDSIAENIIDNVSNNNYGRYKIVGVAVQNDSKAEGDIREVPVVATYETVVDYATKNWVDEILIALMPEEVFPNEIIDELNMMGVTVHVCVANLVNRLGVKQTVGSVGGMMVISSALNYMSARQYIVKRLMDIIGGLIGTIITGILYLILAPMIKIKSPGPAFFTQERIGRNGKPFKLYKFRSMYLDAEERKAELMEQNKLNNNLMFKMDFDPRVIGNRIDKNGNQKTGIGEFIRKYSLDEFPQFINVLKGDMSMVGTRPPVKEEYDNYSAHHKARLATTPGITGLWQVSGRSDILDFERVVQLDTEYINNWSIGLDIKILLKTIKVVIKKEGSV